MAIRKRTISPMIWEDPSFNKLSIQARFIFIGMISNSNDEGYIRADPGSIKRLLFGFDDHTKEEIKNWIPEIRTLNNIHFYSVNNEDYAHFLNWNKYQKQQKDRIQPNEYPLCSKCVASDKQLLTEVKGSKVKEREEKLPASPPARGEEITFVKDEELIPTRSLQRSEAIKDGYKGHEVNPLFKWAEEKGQKFPNPIKQKTAIKKMLYAGYTPEVIKETWEMLEDDEFWADKGIDFGIVLNQIAKTKKKNKPNPLLYGKRT